MSDICIPFEDYYNKLVSRPYTIEEAIFDLQREERAERERVMECEHAHFTDVLHITGQWIGDKKYFESGNAPWMSRNALVLYKKQREVWFAAVSPRVVVSGKRQGFPHDAIAQLCEEEGELRTWLYCIDAKLREQLVKACAEEHYHLICLEKLVEREARARPRIECEEHEAQMALRKRFFLTAPPEFFRQQAIERFGATPPPAARDLTIAEIEAEERERIYEAEGRARAALHAELADFFATELFILNHHEIVERRRIEELERAALYPAISALCRESFGCAWVHVPAVFLHALAGDRARRPALRAFCEATPRRAPGAAPSAVFPAFELPPPAESPAEAALPEDAKEEEAPALSEAPREEAALSEEANASGNAAPAVHFSLPGEPAGGRARPTVRFSTEAEGAGSEEGGKA